MVDVHVVASKQICHLLDAGAVAVDAILAAVVAADSARDDHLGIRHVDHHFLGLKSGRRARGVGLGSERLIG